MSRSHALTLPLTATALLVLAAASPSLNAQVNTQSAAMDTITVVAPRISHERAWRGRVEITTAEKSAYVDYSDLDLTQTHDLLTLQNRVDFAATQVCSELAELYPEGEPDTRTCIRRAKDDAMVLVNDAARRKVALAASDWGD